MNTPSRLALLASISLVGAVAIVFAADNAGPILSTDAALAKLRAGNIRFTTRADSSGRSAAAKRAETAQSQRPFAIIVGCADSRTSPELIFDQSLGDLFVVRTAGNLVNEHALGSIEYAVSHLGARLIIVLGHERCGAVQAALASETAPGHVGSLVRDIQPAVKAIKGKQGDALELAIKENARLIAARIRGEASFGELAKQVRIVSGVYDLDTGKIEWGKE